MKKLLFLLILLLWPSIVFSKEELIENAESGILIEANSGNIIYEKNKDKRVSVASMTKMVAQIIILEEIESGKIHWNDVVSVSKNASDMGGSQIYLEAGEEMSVEDLMKGISVASGNDATVAMAEYISGSEKKFVERMNKKVKDLDLKNTHFVNCTGLDEENHYSSSYDMAMIARELVVNHKEILKFSSIYEDYLRENTDHKFWLVNTNKLISQYKGTDGLKTGHTDNAGYCLAATVKKNNLRLIGIVLGEKDSKVRNQETIKLLDYGFQNVKLKKLKTKGTEVKKVLTLKATQPYYNVVLGETLYVMEDVGTNNSYQFKVSLFNTSYPIKKNKKIGILEVLHKNRVVSSAYLVADRNVDKLNIFQLYKDNILGIIYGNFRA